LSKHAIVESIRSWGKFQFDNFNADASVSVEEIVVGGDWVFARMKYKFRAFPKGGGDPSPHFTGNAMWYLPIHPIIHWRKPLLRSTPFLHLYRCDSAIANPAQVRHITTESGQVIYAELVKMIVPAGPRHYLHQFNRGFQKSF
jgi:hypothetical protein